MFHSRLCFPRKNETGPPTGCTIEGMIDATTPTERIGLAAYLLAQGHTTTARQLAGDLAITEHGARKMLEKLSRVLPLVNDGGVWRICAPPD